VGGEEHHVSQAKGTARDILIHTNQTSPFRLDLRTSGKEVRFDVIYQYRVMEREEIDALLAGPRWGVHVSERKRTVPGWGCLFRHEAPGPMSTAY
jgi:hypothetical protein